MSGSLHCAQVAPKSQRRTAPNAWNQCAATLRRRDFWICKTLDTNTGCREHSREDNRDGGASRHSNRYASLKALAAASKRLFSSSVPMEMRTQLGKFHRPPPLMSTLRLARN